MTNSHIEVWSIEIKKAKLEKARERVIKAAKRFRNVQPTIPNMEALDRALDALLKLEADK